MDNEDNIGIEIVGEAMPKNVSDDHVYGVQDAKQLAVADPVDALSNSDNFEYFMEGVK